MRSPLTDSMDNFQVGVHEWAKECFGATTVADVQERTFRFLEEALELVQACGGERVDIETLADYVFNRPVGEKSQEVGGVMITLTALCTANQINLRTASCDELERIQGMIEQIRQKHATKPLASPLPGDYPQ